MLLCTLSLLLVAAPIANCNSNSSSSQDVEDERLWIAVDNETNLFVDEYVVARLYGYYLGALLTIGVAATYVVPTVAEIIARRRRRRRYRHRISQDPCRSVFGIRFCSTELSRSVWCINIGARPPVTSVN